MALLWLWSLALFWPRSQLKRRRLRKLSRAEDKSHVHSVLCIGLTFAGLASKLGAARGSKEVRSAMQCFSMAFTAFSATACTQDGNQKVKVFATFCAGVHNIEWLCTSLGLSLFISRHPPSPLQQGQLAGSKSHHGLESYPTTVWKSHPIMVWKGTWAYSQQAYTANTLPDALFVISPHRA